MRKKSKPLTYLSFFLLLIVFLKNIDVTEYCANKAKIGLSHFNIWFHKATGVNLFWYTITDYLGLVAILICFAFALLGLMELIKFKSILKVDKSLIALGILYLVLFATYIFFEKIVINYRPIMLNGSKELEPSFPSSHVLLVFTVLTSAIIIIKKRLNSKRLIIVIKTLLNLIIAITVIGRLLSGVHWLTDIIGAIILSQFFLSSFRLYLDSSENNY